MYIKFRFEGSLTFRYKIRIIFLNRQGTFSSSDLKKKSYYWLPLAIQLIFDLTMIWSKDQTLLKNNLCFIIIQKNPKI